MWKPSNGTHPTRQREPGMRKSERIRLLEMEMLRMQFQIEYLNTAVRLLLDENKVTGPDMDAGKWYAAKLNKNK